MTKFQPAAGSPQESGEKIESAENRDERFETQDLGHARTALNSPVQRP
ncbi:hypothetical protein [Streptosporangium vulgare]|uniref:Uncharacterized protein n=1 Tax=Streptosporangium vulgare TaxID=46190 RepID=A0ABV5TI75_9ACTN